MEKKTFINPSVGMIKLEASAMICGSGDGSITTSISNGSGIGGSTPGTTPTATSQSGVTGIFGDARNGVSSIDLDVMDF